MLLDDDSPHFHFYFALSHGSVSFMVPLSEFFSYQNMRSKIYRDLKRIYSKPDKFKLAPNSAPAC